MGGEVRKVVPWENWFLELSMFSFSIKVTRPRVSLPRACHLVVVVKLVCLYHPKSCATREFCFWQVQPAGLVKGKKPDKEWSLVLQAGGLACS